MLPPAIRRAQSTEQKKFESRLLKLAKDEQRTDGKAIRDTDLSKWIAPPVSWGYENLVHIAVKRFRDFLKIMGPRDPRSKFPSHYSSDFLYRRRLMPLSRCA
jgi:hypothetical protein